MRHSKDKEYGIQQQQRREASGRRQVSSHESNISLPLECDFVLLKDGVKNTDALLNCERKPQPDAHDSAFDRGYYCWVICAACFAGQFMFPLGISYGLFNVVLLEQFGRSKMETALVGSVCYGLTAGMGVLSGILANQLGHRITCVIGSLLTTLGYIISAFTPSLTLLYFSYGVLIGTGVSMMSVTTGVMVNFYFKKYRNLATGIMVSGSGIGSLIFPLIIEHFIEAISWRGTMVLLAGISLQGCVIGALLRPNEQLKTMTTNTAKSKTTFHFILFRKWTFIVFTIIFFAQGLNGSILFTISPHHVVTYGFSREQAAFVLFLVGLASTISRMFNGVVFHFFRLNATVALGTAFTGMGVVHLMLAFHHNQFSVLVLVSVGYGLMFGIMALSHPLYVVAFFGLERLNSAYGFSLVGEGLGGLLGPFIAGYIFDFTGDYQIAFIVASTLAFIGSLLNIPMYFYMRRKLARDSIVN